MTLIKNDFYTENIRVQKETFVSNINLTKIILSYCCYFQTYLKRKLQSLKINKFVYVQERLRRRKERKRRGRDGRRRRQVEGRGKERGAINDK